MLQAIVAAGGLAKSYQIAARLLKLIGAIEISDRQANCLTTLVGEELAAQRDQRVAAQAARPLPRQATRVEPNPPLACVEVDGGRMQTRAAGAGPGVHDPHWRETKTAGFFRMNGLSHAVDPHPELPRCFADRARMTALVGGATETDQESRSEGATAADEVDVAPAPARDWRPQVLFRTCLASLESSDRFGPMMAAEADARGFFAAERRAFLADGLAYNWAIQRTHFPTFEPIVDFVHPVERLYAAARAVAPAAPWPQYVAWATAVWQGRASEVVDQLAAQQTALGEPPPDADDSDPRRVVAETLTYLQNNLERMDYPRYRRQGLPVTSALIESLVKEFNYRVKGSEKFWDDGTRGEAILQVRAALLSHDDRLADHLRRRPGSPYARISKNPNFAAA